MSDRVGRLRSMLELTVVQLAVIYFALQLMLGGSAGEFLGGQVLIGIPVSLALGLQGAMVVEIFPLRTRVMSMSLAYSLALMLPMKETNTRALDH